MASTIHHPISPVPDAAHDISLILISLTERCIYKRGLTSKATLPRELSHSD